jgi:mono/diheme cytochrome c family protein
MQMSTRRSRWLLSIALVIGACGDDVSIPDPQDWPGQTKPGSANTPIDNQIASMGIDAGTQGGPAAMEGPPCAPIVAEAEPARLRAFGSSNAIVAASDVWDRYFIPQCGACHATAANGLDVKGLPDLQDKLEDILGRLKSTDRTKVMPPLKKLFTERTTPDPVLEFELMLRSWRESGFKDTFADPRGDSGSSSSAPTLASTPALGKSLTNMGSCVPAARIVGVQSATMDELDAKFAAATDFTSLPKKLSETDLFTLDSHALAEHGVISYAPAYTLWADNAKKMRYVRVPRGSSIVFSPATQSFNLPENTRFYKTFAKEVIDQDGNTGYKKMETRLIVVRRAVTQPGQDRQLKALFGTYVWNEEETEASLLEDPLNDGTPFRDLLTWYVTDESRAAAEIDKAVNAGAVDFAADAPDAEKRVLSKDILIAAGVARHYAVPGSTRCIQCHQGGPDDAFVLGFSPLQIMRRPMGEGGVIEPALADELNQLERFISYGLITGVTLEEISRKILPLEKSQGARSPRTDQELIAQGYMLGNCAHCHNPRGYATQTAPELADLLNFYPNADQGGIFEFPLERISPRIKRKPGGEGLVVDLPYISPSIFDNADGTQPDKGSRAALPAPWRSLIYRNVATPFPYSSADESTIYPHMPLNTPGFDVRAPRIMAEWMISIPARSKGGELILPDLDNRTQPFEQAHESDSDYDFAVAVAGMRLDTFRAGTQFSQTWLQFKDIIDPSVRYPDKPVPENSTESGGMPRRPHWVLLDLTEPPPPWTPRNPAWLDTLVHNKFAVPANSNDSSEVLEAKKHNVELLVAVLQNRRLSPEFTAFARSKMPMYGWVEKPGCDLSAARKKTSYPPAERRDWMAGTALPSDQSPVYEQTPGEAVFGQICVNCHGKRADSRGRQADSLVLMTGGGARVANFRVGLFGPEGLPGSTDGRPGDNIDRVFAAANTDTPHDWAARYMAWMALGGTTKILPSAILAVVANNEVFGRGVNRGAGAEANMLSIAKSVCSSYLPEGLTFPDASDFYTSLDLAGTKTFKPPIKVSALSGDAELWQRLCTFDNPIPVRAMVVTFDNKGQLQRPTFAEDFGVPFLFSRDKFPPNAPVMDHLGNRQTKLTAENQTPWCVVPLPPSDANAATLNSYIVEKILTYCPQQVLVKLDPDLSTGEPQVNEFRLTPDEIRQWTLRGAVNAGFAVFTYVDDLANNRVSPSVPYNHCEDLATSGAP